MSATRIARLQRPFPFIRKVFADAGYQGPRVAEATSMAVKIVKRKPDQAGFAIQPRRWVVERFFAWSLWKVRIRWGPQTMLTRASGAGAMMVLREGQAAC